MNRVEFSRGTQFEGEISFSSVQLRITKLESDTKTYDIAISYLGKSLKHENKPKFQIEIDGRVPKSSDTKTSMYYIGSEYLSFKPANLTSIVIEEKDEEDTRSVLIDMNGPEYIFYRQEMSPDLSKINSLVAKAFEAKPFQENAIKNIFFNREIVVMHVPSKGVWKVFAAKKESDDFIQCKASRPKKVKEYVAWNVKFPGKSKTHTLKIPHKLLEDGVDNPSVESSWDGKPLNLMVMN